MVLGINALIKRVSAQEAVMTACAALAVGLALTGAIFGSDAATHKAAAALPTGLVQTADLGQVKSVPRPLPHPLRMTIISPDEVTTAAMAEWRKRRVSSEGPANTRERIALYEAELVCMADAIYHEARGETRSGRLAVAEVVLNRVSSRAYPNTVCGVVYQGAMAGGKGCQFSFTCDGSLERRVKARARNEAETLSRHVMMGFGRELTSDATHYHADYVEPFWASAYQKTVQIGRHIFYRPMS